MVFAGKSDVGLKRTSNQDNFIVKRLCSNAVLLAVCDGMGGANGGNIASGIATEVISDHVNEFIKSRPDDGPLCPDEKELEFLIHSALTSANEAVYNIAASTPLLNGMGTTAVCAVVCGNRAVAANVGDSRLYYADPEGIRQVSHDHSYVQYLVDVGELSEEQAKQSRQKNIIMRAIGTDKTVNSDIFSIDIAQGSYLLLCTDGLSNAVSNDEMYTVLTDGEKDLNAKLDTLINMANSRGGSDNITAVIAEF